MTRSRQTGDGQPVRLRSTPVTARTEDGQVFQARIVAPAFSRPELRDMVRRDRDNGWLTRGEARRIIARHDQIAPNMAGFRRIGVSFWSPRALIRSHGDRRTARDNNHAHVQPCRRLCRAVLLAEGLACES